MLGLPNGKRNPRARPHSQGQRGRLRKATLAAAMRRLFPMPNAVIPDRAPWRQGPVPATHGA